VKLKKNLQIAIDGPLAAGKGTAAYLLAKKLGILYIDTGAMYRATALLGLRHGLDLTKGAPIVKLLKKAKIELAVSKKNDGRFCTTLLDGEDVTWAIREPRVSWGSSQVGTFPRVRQYLVDLQKPQERGLKALEFIRGLSPSSQKQIIRKLNRVDSQMAKAMYYYGMAAAREYLENKSNGGDPPI